MRKHLRAVVLVSALVLAVGVVGCKEKDEAAGGSAAAADKENPVVMTVNGEAVDHAMWAAAVNAVPEQMKQMTETPQGKNAVARELVRMKVLEQEARRMKLEDDPEVRSRLQLETTNILASAAVDKLIENADEATLREIYESTKEQFEKVRGRQIVVAYDGAAIPPRSGKTLSDEQARAKAEALARRVKDGADFAKVAAAESDDPGAASRGGDFGEIARGEVPPEITEALFGLQPGEISPVVKSRFGYHIFQISEKVQPAFEQVQGLLKAEAKPLVAREIMKKLTDKATLDFNKEIFPTSPIEQEKPADAAAAPAATQPQK